jgi:hypothetical protein
MCGSTGKTKCRTVLLTANTDKILRRVHSSHSVLQDGLAEGQAPLENDALFSVSHMADLLESGTDSQRTVILFELQQLLDHCLDDTINVLIPVLCRNVHTWTYELQISSTEALLDVLQQAVKPDTCKLICDAAFRVVGQSHSEDIFEAWGEILVIGLPHVKWSNENELNEIVFILDSFACDDDDVSRKLAARVYGSFASCLTASQVEGKILNRALELANDPDLEVRGMVAESLAFIGAVVTIEVAEKRVWPKILSLLKDPDARVHAATLRTLANILEAHRENHHDSILYRDLLAPVFARECEFVRKAATADQRTVNDDVYLLLEIISEVFGQLLYAIHPYFGDEAARKDAYKAYLAMATCNGPIVRRYCAFNIPGVSKSIADKFAIEMSSIVEFLSRDTDSETRWNLAAGIHETAALLANNESIDNLFKSVIALLQDENPLVRMNTLEHFYPLLQSLTRESETCYIRRLAPVFQNLTLLSEGNWRTQELLAKQLEQACVLVPPDTLRANVLPLLYQMSEESTSLVRKAAMPAIAKAIWSIPSPQERDDVMQHFRLNWADGGVFWMRMAFIDCAHAASRYYSSQLFRRTFASGVLRMADDPVPNVRLRLASILHVVAYLCKELEELEHAVSVLSTDNDIDVQRAMIGYEERVRVLDKGEETVTEDFARQQAEGDLFDKMLTQKAKEVVRKKHAPKPKFRPSTLLPGKVPKSLNLESGGSSPTSVAESVISPKASRFSTPRRSLVVGGSVSPKSARTESSNRRASWAALGSQVLQSTEQHDLPSPRGSMQKMKTALTGQSSEDDDRGSDGPSSFKSMKKLLALGKKSKK